MNVIWKIFYTMICLISIILSIGGYILIDYGFNIAINNEIKSINNDIISIKFLYEEESINVLNENFELNDSTMNYIATRLENKDVYKEYNIYVLNYEKKVIYQNNNIDFDESLIENLNDNLGLYKINRQNESYYINNIYQLTIKDEKINIQMSKDISYLFDMKNEEIKILVYMLAILVTLGSIFIYGISFAITRPLRILINSVKNISKGDYKQKLNINENGEIGELAREFNIMSETIETNIVKLENIARTQENFVSNFTHELKTPLTAIMGYSDMLRTKILEPKIVHNSSNYIYSESKRLESLTVKLLNLVSMHDTAFTFKKVSVQKLIQDILNLFGPILAKKNIVIKNIIKEKYINIDEDLMKTLLLNILDNAIKASNFGGKIDILGFEENDKYSIKIIDYGIGIPKEEIEKITEPFYMVDKSRSRKENGFGLGLNLCKKIADIHNAKLSFESEVGVGTDVTFEINL